MTLGVLRLLAWMSVVCGVACTVSGLFTPRSDSEAARIPGNVAIGGLIEIHDAGGKNNLNCSELLIDADGMQRLEAMLYAVKQINADSSLLPDINLGVEIRDSCGSETKALDESLQFVIDKVPVCEIANTSALINAAPMYGVIGTGMSIVTAQVASLLRLFKIPQISYGATSIELDDQSKYDFFLRTVPPDSFQVEAMLDFIVQELHWDAVYAISSSGSYGERAIEAFLKAAENASVCILESFRLSPKTTKEEIRKAILKFYTQDKRVTGIVMYCEKPDVQLILDIIDEEKLSDHFQLIGSDAWTASMKSNQSILFSLHYDRSLLSDFYMNHYSTLNPGVKRENVENPWLKMFWDEQCSLAQKQRPDIDLKCQRYNETSFRFCKSDFFHATCSKDDKIPYVIDAVYSFAHALDKMIKTECNSKATGDCLKTKDGKKFFDVYLKQVNFTGICGEISFADGIQRGHYDISMFRSNGSINVVGQWDSGKLTMEDDWVNKFGISTCKDHCQPGYRRLLKDPVRCCWTCIKCKQNEYTADEYTCKECPDGYRPDLARNFTTCYQLEIRHLSLPWLAATILFAALGILFTFIVISSFIRNNDTPLIKASGRELSYILLGGILMLYTVPFMLAVYPQPLPCGVARFSIGFLLCICYASLLIRTNRIARIFSGRPDLSFLTPWWQVVLTGFFVLPEILIGVVGLLHEPPRAVLSYESQEYTIIKCNTESKDLIASLAYNLLLVVMCTVFAFRTRKVPGNFNEARYIGFVMYTTLVIWIAFLPVFFSASSEYQTVAMLLDLLINATTLLVGLFGMKMYILVFRPDKNSRTNSKLRSITLSYFSEGDGTVVIDDRPYGSTENIPRSRNYVIRPPVAPSPQLIKYMNKVDRSGSSTPESIELKNGHVGLRNGLDMKNGHTPVDH